MALQALNSNLQKQLHQERQEKEQLLKNNLETSKTLEEKEKQHQNMLRILNDKVLQARDRLRYWCQY